MAEAEEKVATTQEKDDETMSTEKANKGSTGKVQLASCLRSIPPPSKIGADRCVSFGDDVKTETHDEPAAPTTDERSSDEEYGEDVETIPRSSSRFYGGL